MNYNLRAVASLRSKEAPSLPHNPLSALQLRDEVEVKSDDVRGVCNGAIALHAICNQINFKQILKFHKRVISALILVASFARPKISSKFLRVNGILKFDFLHKTLEFFLLYPASC